MFKRGRLLRSGRIYSDEGFFVIPGRDSLVYVEADRRMTMTVQMGARGFAIYRHTISRWDDSPMNSVSDAENVRIADNVKRALESQGESVIFI